MAIGTMLTAKISCDPFVKGQLFVVIFVDDHAKKLFNMSMKVFTPNFILILFDQISDIKGNAEVHTRLRNRGTAVLENVAREQVISI